MDCAWDLFEKEMGKVESNRDGTYVMEQDAGRRLLSYMAQLTAYFWERDEAVLPVALGRVLAESETVNLEELKEIYEVSRRARDEQGEDYWQGFGPEYFGFADTCTLGLAEAFAEMSDYDRLIIVDSY